MQFPLIHESCSLAEIRSPPHHKRQECKVTCLADWRCVLWVPGEKFWRSWYESQVYCNAAGYVAFSHLFPRFSPDFLHQMTIIRSISWSPFAVQVQFNWLQELCSLCCDLVKNGINPHPFTHEKRGDRYQVLALKQCMLVGHIFFYPDARIGMRTPSDSYWFFWVGRTKNQIWSGNDFQDIWWGETESGEQLTTADSGDTFLVPSMEHSHCFVADGELQDLLRPNAILPSSQMFRREAGWGRWREQFLIVFVFVPRYIDRYQAMKWYLARTWFWWIKINSFHFARSLRDSNRSCRARRASTFKHDSSPTDH